MNRIEPIYFNEIRKQYWTQLHQKILLCFLDTRSWHEFNYLRYAQTKYVSKNDFINFVWGDNEPEFVDRCVRVNISRLNKKLAFFGLRIFCHSERFILSKYVVDENGQFEMENTLKI